MKQQPQHETTCTQIPERTDGVEWNAKAVHWQITIKAGGSSHSFQYSEGIGHFMNLPYNARITLDIAGVQASIQSGQPFSMIGHHDYLTKYFTARVQRKKGLYSVTPPQSLDVLQSLGSDAQLGLDTFEDFCGNLGYDTDSRKALKAWEACRDTRLALERMGFDINALCEE